MLGFRFHGGLGSTFGVVGLALLIGLAFSWINVLLGPLITDSESAGLAGLFPVIALVFTSSTFVPVSTMPGWLEGAARPAPGIWIGGGASTRLATSLGAPGRDPA